MALFGLVACLGPSATSAAPSDVAPGVEALEPPFIAGQDGFAVYRIPSLIVTRAGTLLAIAEGRVSKRDHSENRIVLRRSTDGGHHWRPLQIVAADGHNSLNNPCAVLLHDSGRVLLAYQHYPAALDEFRVQEGVAGDQTCLCFLTSSDDDGQTWSKPIDITRQIKRPTGATSIASGPGIGIELRHGPHAGRIILPFNQGPRGNWQVYAACSDDGGHSWHYGQLAPEGPDGRGNEVQMVELSDGRVMLDTRWSSGKRCRKIAISTDGGESWSTLRDEPALVDPQCEASLLRYDRAIAGEKTGALLFVNPATTNSRTHGTVRLSTDEGKTWSATREIVPGSFAYSCLGILPDGSIACIYETDNYGKIALLRFTMDWLRSRGADARTARE